MGTNYQTRFGPHIKHKDPNTVYSIRYLVYSIGYMVYSKGYISTRILQTMISGIPIVLGPGTRISDLSVYVVFWGPTDSCSRAPLCPAQAPSFEASPTLGSTGLVGLLVRACRKPKHGCSIPRLLSGALFCFIGFWDFTLLPLSPKYARTQQPSSLVPFISAKVFLNTGLASVTNHVFLG